MIFLSPQISLITVITSQIVDITECLLSSCCPSLWSPCQVYCLKPVFMDPITVL